MKVHTRESIVHQKIRRVARLRPDVLVKRIENLTDVGMPDMVVLLGGVTYFVEAKMGRLRVNEVPAVKVRPSQVNWIEEWSEAGGHVLVIVALPDGSLHSVGPEFVRRMRAEGLKPEFVVRSVRGPLTYAGLYSLLTACQYGAHVKTPRSSKVEIPGSRRKRADAERLASTSRSGVARGADVPFVLEQPQTKSSERGGPHRASFARRLRRQDQPSGPLS